MRSKWGAFEPLSLPDPFKQCCWVCSRTYPILYSLYISFFRWDIFTPQPMFCGFDNYVAMFRSRCSGWC